MPIKIIATDLDGTLMSPDHVTITERTKNTLLKAHNMGIKIAIATGRTLGFITPVVEQIPFVDFVIFSNGASVYDVREQKIIYKNHISPESTHKILEKLHGLNVYYNTYVDSTVYIQEGKQQFYTNRDLPEDFLKLFMASSKVCKNLAVELNGKSAEIIAVYSSDETLRNELNEYFKSLGLLVTASLKDEIEATVPSANKGTALKGLCELLKIKREETMAFGDALNDIQMIEFAGFSFAMGNACEELKKAASFITLSNAEDGLAAAVEKYAFSGNF
ncbi:MAG: HAD family hydrolase [Oscillospiraceae bacterium]|nr:HAD family hydrolase [Oscillospiraceae bacterium]